MRRLLLCASLLLVAPALHAQSAADVATARDLFKEGLDLREKGKLTDALAKLRAAHDLYETPPSTLELGRTQMLLGQLVEAYETLLAVEKIATVAKESDRSKDARVEARKLAGDVRARIPTLQVNVDGAKEGSTVLLDGSTVQPSLFGVARKQNPGHHVVVARNASGAEARVETDLVERDVKVVTLTVPASSATTVPTPAPTPAPGDTSIRFGVLYKFLPPPPDGEAEQWTLKDAKGTALCTLPCERWLGERNGTYLERTKQDDEARRVELPEELPAPVGSTVTARPAAGKGYVGLAKLGGVMGGLGFLGLLIGVPFAITGGIIGSDTSTTSTSGHDFLVAGLVTSGISAVFLAGGLALSFTNRAPGLMMETAPAPGARAWLTPSGVAGTF